MSASVGRTAQRIHCAPSRARSVLLLIALAVVGALDGSRSHAAVYYDPTRYPSTPQVSVVDDYHGTAVADPWRWLESIDSPETRHWVGLQNGTSRPILSHLPLRAKLEQRLTQLYAYERFGVPLKAGPNYFFLRNDGGQDQAALHVSQRPQELGRFLIDPASLRGDATVSLAEFVPSPDGRLLAYALSDGGSDWKIWRVRDVATGDDLADELRQTKFTRASWARDASGFWYSRYPDGDDQRQPVVMFHRVGTPQSDDAQVYAVTDHPRRTPEATLTMDGRFLIVTLDDGTLTNGVDVLDLKKQRTLRIFDRYDGLYTFLGARSAADLATELLFRTTAQAPRGRVIAVRIDPTGAPPRVREVLAESDVTLVSAALVGDRLIANHLADAHARVTVHDPADGRLLAEVALPGLGTVAGFTGENPDAETFFSYSDYATPTRIYRLDTRSLETQVVHAPQIGADLSPYVTEQVFFTSKDGTRVPMFLVHRRDLVRNGRNPVMLYGYGGFDISVTPSFSPATLAWLEMGGVYAVANLRGGGEYGAAWHVAGTRARKQNVFDDFIAAAEYLIRERYTRPSRLAIRGVSNGGLLVGAVVTQRPELFAAALPDVGVMDMLRYHLASANARLWSDDYGLSDDADDFRAQLAYSPVQNAYRQRCFPAMLITTAIRDNRVVPWHSYKFTAAVQRAQQCRKAVLLNVETRAGHGSGKPTWMQIEQFAELWAFAAAALNVHVPRFPTLAGS